MPEAKPFETARKWISRLSIIASLVLLWVNRSGLATIFDQLGDILIFAILILICEICFVAGLALMLVGLGTSFDSIFGWLKALWQVRKDPTLLLGHLSASRVFRLGFNLNWLAAVGTGVLAVVGVITVLPVSGWGLLVPAVLDILASFGIRVPIELKFRALKEAS